MCIKWGANPSYQIVDTNMNNFVMGSASDPSLTENNNLSLLRSLQSGDIHFFIISFFGYLFRA